MDDFDPFNQHIEDFKAQHKLTPFKCGPVVTPGDGQIPTGFKLMEDLVHNILNAKLYIFDYGLDSQYRICSILDPILQYAAFDASSERFIFWNEDRPDGLHPAESMARIFELDGIEVELEVDEEGNSQTTLYHAGKITRITDNHDRSDRHITVDGEPLVAPSVIDGDVVSEDWYSSALKDWDDQSEKDDKRSDFIDYLKDWDLEANDEQDD
jgi:hypothetical protein